MRLKKQKSFLKLDRDLQEALRQVARKEMLGPFRSAKELKKALEDHPNLILLDIRIPKMDGMTVLKHLRADTWGKNAKVIILTNLDATDHILQGVVDDHPSYYMVKSNTRPEIVLEHIKEVIEE